MFQAKHELANSETELLKVTIPKMSTDFRIERPHSQITCALNCWYGGTEQAAIASFPPTPFLLFYQFIIIVTHLVEHKGTDTRYKHNITFIMHVYCAVLEKHEFG